MSPHAGAAVLQAATPDATSRLLSGLALHVGAGLLRRLGPERRADLLARVPEQTRRTLQSLASHPDQTAGSLMDPLVLALPDDFTAREARARVRATPEQARYNVYVIDREHRLVGALNLRELFLAAPSASLRSVMVPHVHRLSATADRRAIVRHPGWREVHSLPVVDPSGHYLGAIRYRALRRIEEELRGVADAADITVDALGDLFSAGASGVLKALTADKGGSP